MEKSAPTVFPGSGVQPSRTRTRTGFADAPADACRRNESFVSSTVPEATFRGRRSVSAKVHPSAQSAAKYSGSVTGAKFVIFTGTVHRSVPLLTVAESSSAGR